MAETLGIRPYDSSADDLFARRTSIAIQSLGKQLREDMTSIAANREVRVLGEELRQLDPRTPAFPTQLMQTALSNPLGSQHPVGKLAIEMLGAQHKAWEAENRVDRRLESQERMLDKRLAVPSYRGFGRGGLVESKTGDVLREPEYPLPTEKETPAQREAREKRLIDYRAAAKPEKQPTLTDLAKLKELTDGMLGTERALQEERSKKPGMFGSGGPDAARIKRLEDELKSAQEIVRRATAAIGPTVAPVATATPVKPAVPDKRALAEQALNDPSASERDKAQAAKILGVKRPLTKEAVAAAINEVGNDQPKIKALLEQRGYAVD